MITEEERVKLKVGDDIYWAIELSEHPFYKIIKHKLINAGNDHSLPIASHNNCTYPIPKNHETTFLTLEKAINYINSMILIKICKVKGVVRELENFRVEYMKQLESLENGN